jgi:hypothetical protein
MSRFDRAVIPLAITAVIVTVCIMGLRADFDRAPQSCDKAPSQPLQPARSDTPIDDADGPCDSFLTRTLLAAESG